MSTHLINGRWTDGADGEFFQAVAPATNSPLPKQFAEGGGAEVDSAAQTARAAFTEYGGLPDKARAAFLRAIAERIDKRGDEITTVAEQETALPAARLTGERGRTVNQLCMFADFIESGRHLDIRHDEALPERAPLPRPDLRLMAKPLGVVGVFGASNFPLAFSVAGGDTAAALAAGCPVIVKGHPAHPHTGKIVATAVAEAIADCDIPPGAFAFIQGTTPALSRSLVEHPVVGAIGFTGSLRAGRELFNAACRRPVPIPFYAEMGSINPVFLSPTVEDLNTVAQGWAQSLVLGGGQFCTNPGVLFCPADSVETFKQMAVNALSGSESHTMLTPGIAAAYCQATAAVAQHKYWQGNVGDNAGCATAAILFSCNISEWLDTTALQDEMFGPAGVIVGYQDMEELTTAAHALVGQLTATMWLATADNEWAGALLPILEQKAGRLIVNGFPTGVEVADAMMHGGPYPAATYSATSVGSLAIRRFLRPVCYQNFPDELLPPVLRNI